MKESWSNQKPTKIVRLCRLSQCWDPYISELRGGKKGKKENQKPKKKRQEGKDLELVYLYGNRWGQEKRRGEKFLFVNARGEIGI